MAFSPAIEKAKNEFARRHGLDPNAASTVEAFCTHHVLLHRNMNEFLAEQSWRGERAILVGGAQDTQIDAIVVCIEGKPIRPEDDLADLERAAAEGERPEISFLFVQATSEETTSTKLGHKISAFSDGVFAFFRNDGTSARGVNGTIMRWVGLKNRIFQILDENELEGCCECAMYFAWPKVLQADDNIERTIQTAREKVAAISRRFSKIDFHAFDRKRLEEAIANAPRERDAAPALDLIVPRSNFLDLPHPPEVEACMLGYLTAADLIALLSTDAEREQDREIRWGLFSSNIRSYLGSNHRVNSAMCQTLRSPEERAEFGIRSNGIAILAFGRSEPSPDRWRLHGAQIVNGCQTCNVLFENRALLGNGVGSEISIPVKIIVARDQALADRAALGLNRQTPVDEARLFTGQDMVDALGWRFSDPSTPEHNRALFERREGEHRERPAAEQWRVITTYELARAYASVFLPNPEHVNVKGKQHIILEIRNQKIFGSSQNIAPCFLCGVMLLRAREALERHANAKKWDRYPAKNLLLYAMRVMAERKAVAGTMPGDLETEAGKAYVAAVSGPLLDLGIASRIANEAVNTVILASSDAQLRLNSKNAGKAELAKCVRDRALRAKV